MQNIERMKGVFVFLIHIFIISSYICRHELKEAYLHPKAARALLKAQRLLRKLHPQYRLIIYDAARPLSIQGEMWNVVKGTSRNIYVSNPAHGGGLHNYGLAVDISIVDDNGKALDMGTPVDFMKMGDEVVENIEVIPTGSIGLNAALGVGGYPRGRVIEIYGPESSGKTTLAIHEESTIFYCLPRITGSYYQ